MAEVQQLSVELRGNYGKRRNRRLRVAGKVPAVLYGHKQEPVALTVSLDAVESVIRHGHRFVQLTGAASEQAFIKECQWDTWGTRLLHIDFARVSAHEKIRVTVPVELRGEAPGVKEGGVVKHMMHQIELECEAASVPDKLEVNINYLQLHDIVHAGDLKLPQGVVFLGDTAAVVVSCSEAVEAADVEESSDAAEPEVIGRKKAEEEEA